MSAGFIVSTSQLPYLLRWIKLISVHRLTYQVLISLEFTDRVFSCPYESLPPPTSPNSTLTFRCTSFDGNHFLKDQLEGHAGYFPVPIAYFCLHFSAFTFATWLALSVRSPDSTFGSSRSPLKYVQESIAGLIQGSRKTAPMSLDSAAHDKEMAIDIPQSLSDGEETLRQSVEIRIENLSLLSTTRACFNAGRPEFFSGRVAQSEVLTKTYFANIDFVIPPAQLTAILGASGSGKVIGSLPFSFGAPYGWYDRFHQKSTITTTC